MTVLSVENLSVSYGPVVAVRDVSLQLAAGEAVALIGSNGAGKSSTLKAILGLVPISKGKVSVGTRELQRLPSSSRVKGGVALSPEGRQVFPDMTVLENLELGYGHQRRDGFRELCDEMYTTFPRLAERAHQRAGTLSGGEQQMLAIARALMSRPKVLMLDEPTLGLAPKMVDQVSETIRHLKSSGLGVLLAEQNVQMALSVADRGYVLETGSLVASGNAASLLSDPRVRAAYLGL